MKLARMFLALALTAGMVLGVQVLAATQASAGSVPPPSTCGTAPNYQYGSSQCWGAAGNPPTGCITGNTVNNTEACLQWRSQLPTEAQPTQTTGCADGQIAGPFGSCCAATDQQCLTGVVTTPQGDANSLALAKKVCNDIKSVTGIDPAQVPFDCTLDQPNLNAGIAACHLAQSASGGSASSSPIWMECAQLTVAAAGQANPTNPPQADDPQTAKQACQLALSTAGVDSSQIPQGCNGNNPSVQDGVNACKALVTGSAAQGLSGNPIIQACLSLITRNPLNVGATTTTVAQAVVFNDTDVKKLTSGLTFFALVVCIGGIFVSTALWAMGSKGQNEGQQHTGKRGVIVSIVAAFILGALPQIFAYLDLRSHDVDNNGVTNQGLVVSPTSSQTANEQPTEL